MEDYLGKGDELSLFEMRDSNKTVTDVVQNNLRYNALYIPEGTRTVWQSAFYNVNVKTVVLPSGLETIKSNAFASCKNFKRIYIPESVKVIEKDAFAGCKQLKIYCEGEPQSGWLDKPDEKKVYYDDMTEAFNFHRSSGSFDDHYIVERTEILRNTYNPEGRPVHTNVPKEEFLKLLAAD